MPDANAKSIRSNQLFLILFAIYTFGAVLLLASGLMSALASTSEPLRNTLEAMGRGESLLDQVWRAVARSAPLVETPWELFVDYALSILNLAFGIFIVWRRPGDWVARLLGLGMVGTAMAYNFQAHGILTVLRLFNVLHYVYHATSGATYLHALVMFPNGKIVPNKFKWIIGFIYFLMLEETLLPTLKLTFGRALFLPTSIVTAANPSIERFIQLLTSTRSGGMFVAFFDTIFQINNPLNDLNSIIEAETTFFVLLFGVLLPVIGIASQVYRYRAVSSPQERHRTKIVVWALTVSFTIGFLFVLFAVLQSITLRAGLTVESLEEIEKSVSWVFPLMVSVIPISLWIAILRYGLFDIDFVINRTLVYGPLTAILAGVFAMLSNVLQKVFLAFTGTQSDIAGIVAALVVAMAFAPIRTRLQNLVDGYFGKTHNPRQDLNRFDTQVQSSIELSNRNQMIRHFLQAVASAFDVEGAAVYLGKQEPRELCCTFGVWNGIAQLSMPIETKGTQLGTIALGKRKSGLDYSDQDRENLYHTASLVAQAISAV
jgi:hypothetical protein